MDSLLKWNIKEEFTYQIHDIFMCRYSIAYKERGWGNEKGYLCKN